MVSSPPKLLNDQLVEVHSMVDVGRLVGQTINSRYEVRELLGRGGSGHVYKAFDTSENRIVALKIFKYISSDDSESIIRFEKEVAVYDKLQNEHCARLYDHGVSEEGYLVLAMEFLDGSPLGLILTQEAPLEAGRAVAITCQILEALVGAHGQGIVHRDLKPDNVFITRTPEGGEFVKVLDFGIAKFLEAEAANETLSRDGFVFGTPQYICPEQALGWQVSPASDIYSLGVVLFEMLAGTTPFQSDTAMGLGMKHIYEPAPMERLSSADPVLRALRAVLSTMLEKRPERRPVDASEALGLLRGLGQVPWVRFDVVGSSQSNGGKATPNVPTVRARPIGSELAPSPEEAAGEQPPVDDSALETLEDVVRSPSGRPIPKLSTGTDKTQTHSAAVAPPPKVPPLPTPPPLKGPKEPAAAPVADTSSDLPSYRSSERQLGYGFSNYAPVEEEEPTPSESGIPTALWIILVLGLLLVGFVLYAMLKGPSGPQTPAPSAAIAGLLPWILRLRRTRHSKE